MQPGRYVIKPSSSSVYVARMLNNGWQTPTRLVLSGTMRRKGDIARKIGNQMLVDSAEVAAALNDDALLAKYGFNSVNVFSLFIPDTYEMYWTASVEEILTAVRADIDVHAGGAEQSDDITMLGIRFLG